ncbi:NAD(P)-dependent oxidoreductase [Roseovarius sp. M141]|uniref:NAD(P)-dependent oxidoreductase n=1 Tax=Roseovarius sp. M141 TaxID=2583806 RepID=UPI003383A292|nr:siroheme synthase [Roseovarius sp. M141]
MKHFPIFIALEGRRVVLSGGGDAALAKLRLLMKTEAHLTVLARAPAPEIEAWAAEGRLALVRRPMVSGDARGAVLFYAADEDASEDARTAALARNDGALTNIVDNLIDSQFITPAIVDRDPVTVAIGTEGAAPVLARAIKADIEAMLPRALGPLARAARGFRSMADALPMGRVRRAFWSSFFFRAGPAALEQDPRADLHAVLSGELAQHLGAGATAGRITFAIVASPDAELLPQKTRRVLHEADLVLHGGQIAPEVLELARREAAFGALPATARALIDAAMRGDHVICLTPAPPESWLVAACLQAGLPPQIIPGIAPAPNLYPLKETA